MEDHSSNGEYIDHISFDARHNDYLNDSYYFNGVLKGDIRLHDAIRQCLREGMARLTFRQGSVGLINYAVYENPDIDYTVDLSDTYLRSRTTKNQPTSTILNSVSVMYNHNPAKGEYEGKQETSDVDSMAKFERQEYRGEYTLIKSDTIALKIAEYIIDRLAHPITVTTIDMFMPAYVLEKGDLIQYPSIFEGVSVTGHVASVDRVMGKGKNNQMNKFQISVTDSEIV